MTDRGHYRRTSMDIPEYGDANRNDGKIIPPDNYQDISYKAPLSHREFENKRQSLNNNFAADLRARDPNPIQGDYDTFKAPSQVQQHQYQPPKNETMRSSYDNFSQGFVIKGPSERESGFLNGSSGEITEMKRGSNPNNRYDPPRLAT